MFGLIVTNDKGIPEIVQVIECDEKFIRRTQKGTWAEASVLGIGWKFYKGAGFLPDKPFESWIYVDGTWEPPVEKPDPMKGLYSWNEGKQIWEEVVFEGETEYTKRAERAKEEITDEKAISK